jgi:probable phosphoglycerate mutase
MPAAVDMLVSVKIDFQRVGVPEGAREVLLIRHGACDPPGPDGLIGGRSDPSLNAAGRAQAEAVTRLLADRANGPLFASRLRRTRETIAGLGRTPVELPDLDEVYLGEWEGHGIATRGMAGDPEFLAMLQSQRWDVIPGSESAADFAARCRSALAQVAAAVTDAPAIVATHAGTIAEMLRIVTGSDGFAFLQVANGGLSRVAALPDGRWTLLSFNETAHLAGV